MKKLNVSEIFHSVQGEGKTVGRNVVFLRLAKCNLKCEFCDSKYSWVLGRNAEIRKIVNYVNRTSAQGLCITGGEPLLQRDGIIELVDALADKKQFFIEIETNGTISPGEELINNPLVNFNVSPKLENSENEKKLRYNQEVLTAYANEKLQHKTIYKFVITNNEDLAEVKNIITDCGINKHQVYLMPEGITEKEQTEKQEKVISLALENGWNFSPRIQVIIWNTKRGV
jgi:7-carboxy-7-deazaguanine synthase